MSESEPADAPLVDALAQVSFLVMATLSRVAAANDLSLTQLRALAVLRGREPRMADLAEHLGLDRSSVSGLIDRAAKRGLVSRVASDTDRRSARVALSADGRRLAEQIAGEVAVVVGDLTAGLSGPERRQLTRLLERLLRPSP
jgi:MarR family transcriptional regulator, lower aerobic nicotinate degradation pathway regulator